MRSTPSDARVCCRVLKLARTVADLTQLDTIAASHIAEALRYQLRVGA